MSNKNSPTFADFSEALLSECIRLNVKLSAVISILREEDKGCVNDKMEDKQFLNEIIKEVIDRLKKKKVFNENFEFIEKDNRQFIEDLSL